MSSFVDAMTYLVLGACLAAGAALGYGLAEIAEWIYERCTA